jgi:phosphoribosylformylglycinamidine synthase
MEYLTFPGDDAYTSSAARKIQDSINKSGTAKVEEVSAVWIHYAYIRRSNGRNAEAKLRELLPGSRKTLDTALASVGPRTGVFYITPRNISPLSSKATSIAHVCGLKDQVHRLERGRIIFVRFSEPFEGTSIPFKDLLYDRMTEHISITEPDMTRMFAQGQRVPLEVVDIFADGVQPFEVLKEYNRKRGLALDELEMEYLIQAYTQLKRPPYDVELFMFAQVNSEHCRHKQFNANWTIDGLGMGKTLFEMIKNTHSSNPKFTVSAYSDNAAVLEGNHLSYWAPDYSTGSWKATKEMVHYLVKVETHNHPTAIRSLVHPQARVVKSEMKELLGEDRRLKQGFVDFGYLTCSYQNTNSHGRLISEDQHILPVVWILC